MKKPRQSEKSAAHGSFSGASVASAEVCDWVMLTVNSTAVTMFPSVWFPEEWPPVRDG
jgi:hypothetical protein